MPDDSHERSQRRVVVELDEDFYEHLQRLAWTHQVSPSFLAKLAVLQLLLKDVRGEFSLVPEFQEGKHLYKA